MSTVERGMLTGILMGVVLLATSTQVEAQDGAQDGEWHFHGGDSGFTTYSPLDQIDADNVEDLQIVWRRPAVGTELQERCAHPFHPLSVSVRDGCRDRKADPDLW